MPKKTSRQSSRKTSRQSSKKTSRKTSKQSSRKTSRQSSKKTSRKTSKQTSKKTSRKSSRKTSRQSSKKTSRKTSKQTSRPLIRLPKPSGDMHLSLYGYNIKDSEKKRHNSLKRASVKYSKLPVLRHLNLIRNLTKKDSLNKAKLSRDVEYLKKNYSK
jgi:hypothetical protein